MFVAVSWCLEALFASVGLSLSVVASADPGLCSDFGRTRFDSISVAGL